MAHTLLEPGTNPVRGHKAQALQLRGFGNIPRHVLRGVTGLDLYHHCGNPVSNLRLRHHWMPHLFSLSRQDFRGRQIGKHRRIQVCARRRQTRAYREFIVKQANLALSINLDFGARDQLPVLQTTGISGLNPGFNDEVSVRINADNLQPHLAAARHQGGNIGLRGDPFHPGNIGDQIRNIIWQQEPARLSPAKVNILCGLLKLGGHNHYVRPQTLLDRRQTLAEVQRNHPRTKRYRAEQDCHQEQS